MRCQDFRRQWDDMLDAREATLTSLPPELEPHAATCPACRSTAADYLLLGQAFAALAPPPPASAESLARLRTLRVPAEPIPSRSRFPKFPTRRIAAAATILVLVGVGYGARHQATRPPLAPVAIAIPAPVRPLGAAWEDAARATIDLARDAYAPATRIGREALVLDQGATHQPGVAEANPPADATGGPVGLLEAVGERVNAGVGPISGSARHAFSFLLRPEPDPRPATPDAQGTL